MALASKSASPLLERERDSSLVHHPARPLGDSAGWFLYIPHPSGRGSGLKRRATAGPLEGSQTWTRSRTDLSPTDYALSWALTDHLAIKRVDDFLDYIRVMSQIPPMEPRSTEDHLRTFKAAFGDKLGSST